MLLIEHRLVVLGLAQCLMIDNVTVKYVIFFLFFHYNMYATLISLFLYLVCAIKRLVSIVQQVNFWEVEERVVFFVYLPIFVPQKSASG